MFTCLYIPYWLTNYVLELSLLDQKEEFPSENGGGS